MISQVNYTVNNKNVFSTLQSNDYNYAITKPFSDNHKKKNEQEKEKSTAQWGLRIAKVGLLTGFGMLLVTKGVPKTFINKISNSIKNFRLSRKPVELNGKLETAKSFTKYSKSIFNLAPLKDILFKKLTDNVPGLKQAAAKITEVFEKVSVRTAKKTYSKTLVHVDNLEGTIRESLTKLNLPKEKVQEIEQSLTSIKNKYSQNFGLESRRQRLIQSKYELRDIAQKVWQRTYGNAKNYVTDKKNFQSFISEELAAQSKIKLQNNVYSQKEHLTSTVKDKHEFVKKLLDNIKSAYCPSDKSSLDLIQNLEKQIAAYKTTGSKAAKDAVVQNLDEVIKNIPNDELANLIKESKQIFANNNENTGELQKLLELYKGLGLPPKDLASIEKAINKTATSLNKSADIETDKLFDKVRDLLIGAAPLDVLSIISSFGVVAYGLSKADDKDQKISVALKYGIPAVGAVSISLLCTLALVSGGPALAIGLASGVLINKIGSALDNARKKQKTAPLTPTNIIPNIRKVIEA